MLLPGAAPKKDPAILKDSALSIVPYEKCFESKIKFDFKVEPTELDAHIVQHNEESFARANKRFFTKGGHETAFNPIEYVTLDASIGAILQRLDKDLGLKDVMVEFLNHYRDFYQRTNIILDAVGFENILFFKDDDGDWQFKIGSAIKHDTGNYTNELFATLRAGNELSSTSFVDFTHAYFSPANIRAVNVCALQLGLEPVINDVTIDPQELLKITQLLSVPERMSAYARHGDFAKVETILQENIGRLSFNLRDFWTYSLIADEYIRRGKPREAKNYLDKVSELTVVLPERDDDAKRIRDAKADIISSRDRLKEVLKTKALIHQELVSKIVWQTKSGAPKAKHHELHHLEPTESSTAKKRDKHRPLQMTPKKPWKP